MAAGTADQSAGPHEAALQQAEHGEMRCEIEIQVQQMTYHYETAAFNLMHGRVKPKATGFLQQLYPARPPLQRAVGQK